PPARERRAPDAHGAREVPSELGELHPEHADRRPLVLRPRPVEDERELRFGLRDAAEEVSELRVIAVEGEGERIRALPRIVGAEGEESEAGVEGAERRGLCAEAPRAPARLEVDAGEVERVLPSL